MGSSIALAALAALTGVSVWHTPVWEEQTILDCRLATRIDCDLNENSCSTQTFDDAAVWVVDFVASELRVGTDDRIGSGERILTKTTFVDGSLWNVDQLTFKGGRTFNLYGRRYEDGPYTARLTDHAGPDVSILQFECIPSERA